jgi:hypothetical protein
LGRKSGSKGYNLPYSAGLSINYFWQDSEINIKNLKVGFNNGPLYNLDEIVRFDKSSLEVGALTLTIRPNIWLLPFLNVYDFFEKSNPTTKINAGIWIPDADNNWSQIASFNPKVNFSATTFGLGLTPTIGIGGGWPAMNMSWSDVSALDKPAFSYIFGPRLGKAFKLRKPERNIAVWVGGFRVHIEGNTQGNINLSDVLNLDGAQQKVDDGLTKVSENQTKVDTW